MSTLNSVRAIFACVSLLALAACGGGGGSSSLRLTLSPNPLSASFHQWDLPARLTVDATVAGSTSATQIYVLIADPAGFFQDGPIPVEQHGSTSFSGYLTVPTSASTGAHSGTLQIRVCGDAACASQLSGASLPYAITLDTNPTVTLSSSIDTLIGKSISDPDILTEHEFDAGAVGWNLPVFTLQGEPIYPVYMQVTDAAGIVTLSPSLTSSNVNQLPTVGPINGTTFQAAFESAVNLSVGQHKGTLQFKLCHDPQCTMVFSGNSSLPYALTVAATNLTPLTSLAGAPDWQGVRGNAANNSYVPVTLNPANFSPRWIYAPGNSNNPQFISGIPLTSNGSVIFPTEVNLRAIDENDASALWTSQFSLIPGDAMFESSNHIYAYDSQYNGVLGFNTTDGSLLFNVTAPSTFISPIPVSAGDVVLLPASSNSIDSYDATSGAAKTAPACLQNIQLPGDQRTVPTPALDQSLNAYIPSIAGLIVANFGTSGSCTQIAQANLGTVSMLVPGTQDVLVTGPPSAGSDSEVVDFDTTHSTIKWVSSGYASAAANGVVYVIGAQSNRQPEVEALSESDGHVLWTWAPLGTELDLGVDAVTDNQLLVGSEQRLYAVDLTTHEAAWSLTEAGESPAVIAVSSNGILYLTNGGGETLLAVNLH